jgi:hypothetical protein
METAPGAAPKKKSNTGLVIGLIIGAVVICCIVPIGGLIGFGFLAVSQGNGMISCTISTELAAQAVRAYTQENNGKLPSGPNWQEQLWPYFELESKEADDTGPFKLWTKNEAWGCDEKTPTGFAFNSAVLGKSLSELKDQRNTVVLFETPTRKMNLVQEYKPQAFESSPEVLGGIINGAQRGWFVITADGESRLVDKKGTLKQVKATGRRK